MSARPMTASPNGGKDKNSFRLWASGIRDVTFKGSFGVKRGRERETAMASKGGMTMGDSFLLVSQNRKDDKGNGRPGQALFGITRTSRPLGPAV